MDDTGFNMVISLFSVLEMVVFLMIGRKKLGLGVDFVSFVFP